MPTTFPPCLLRYHSEGGAKRYRALVAKNSEGGAKRYRAPVAKDSGRGAMSLSIIPL